MNIRALIVDDEALARRGLALRLADHGDVQLVGQYDNAGAALNNIDADRPDVLFLDIEMPGLSGLELATRLPPLACPGGIVFVTAYHQHAVAAFERNACDYLLKPVTRERLGEALQRVRDRLAQQSASEHRDGLLAALRQLRGEPDLTLDDALTIGDSTLSFTEDGVQHRLPIGEIDYVEAAGDYMCLRAGDRTHVLRRTLAELLDALGPAFVRVHRSAAVNGSRLRRFEPNGHGDGWVVLAGGHRLRCSRTYRGEVLERL